MNPISTKRGGKWSTGSIRVNLLGVESVARGVHTFDVTVDVTVCFFHFFDVFLVPHDESFSNIFVF